MGIYLNRTFVDYAFKRLVSNTKTGKTHLERTSAIFYFLGFDAAIKFLGGNHLDLNPDTLAGRDNRKQLAFEFEKLVLISKSPELKQVIELGKITEGGTAPEKRISSNFLTVPLKKASEQKRLFTYPGRPAPLFKMGSAGTGCNWGLTYFDDWKSNFLKFFIGIKSNTPLIDLSVFVFRDQPFETNGKDLTNNLEEHIKSRFTKGLTDFWIAQIKKEKLWFNYAKDLFIDHHSVYGQEPGEREARNYETMTKRELVEIILKLETELEEIKRKNK